MSCELRITGENLDVDAFVEKTAIEGFRKSYKGQPIYKGSSRIAKRSSAAITTSDADFDDINTQIDETVEFLTKHKDNLKQIATTADIEFATIDFGVDSIIDEEHLIQGFYFTKPLIKICAELDIGIELSIYKPDMQVILEKRRVKKSIPPNNNL